MADARYEIDSISSTEPDSFQGLTKTWFSTGGAQVYVLHKPENQYRAGDIIEGTVTQDKGGNLKFTRAKNQFYNPATNTTSVSASIPGLHGQQMPLADPVVAAAPLPDYMPRPTTKVPEAAPEKVFKADPDKMKQTYTLEVAKNMSIARQVAVKAAVELTASWNYNAEKFYKVYVDVMVLLSEPDWTKFAAPIDNRFENELPPVENYDNLPTDADVAATATEQFDNDLDRALAENLADPKK